MSFLIPSWHKQEHFHLLQSQQWHAVGRDPRERNRDVSAELRVQWRDRVDKETLLPIIYDIVDSIL
jgi:hypothetical protein